MATQLTNTLPLVSAEEVARLQREGRTINLIDVRTPVEFADVHATGARNLPLDQLNARALLETSAGASFDRGGPIYVICKSGARAAKACQALLTANASTAPAAPVEVFSIEGGTDAWVRAGLPVVRGTKRAMSLERQVRIAAGALVLVGVILGTWVSPWLYGLSAFVGAGLVFAGVTDTCGMAMVLARMPWNRAPAS